MKGFTLVETLVVVLIIGILASIVLFHITSARQEARIVTAKQEVKNIFNSFLLLEADTEEWPDHKAPGLDECGGGGNEICPDGCAISLSDCESGLVCDDGFFNDWDGPYLSAEHLFDPWGNEYFFDTDYTLNEECVVVIGSYGPNGVGNNQYDADDVVYVLPLKQ